jgi:hypothetical protein
MASAGLVLHTHLVYLAGEVGMCLGYAVHCGLEHSIM